MEKYLSLDNKLSIEKIINNEEEFMFYLDLDGKKYLLDFSDSSVVYMGVQNAHLVSDFGVYYNEDNSLLNKLEEDSNNILSLTNYKQIVVRIDNKICDFILINPPVFKEIK